MAFHATPAPLALEVTAANAADQAQTDLNTDMKVSAFSAAVQAAFNTLKAQVDAFNARIAALEARPSGHGTLTWGSCYQTAAWYGSDVTCANGYVVQAVCSSGKNPDCAGNFTRVTCCQLSIQ
jgi:hypothetical protein